LELTSDLGKPAPAPADGSEMGSEEEARLGEA
jgi:hypothetical protein